ncbi:hypothetical protein BJ170DRAFT_420085 [Xylariales sp. AK1849]|nr:hypothetical protein BJ170DRAFT_420085 [Xylariales sp. AK1849]
MLVIHVCLTSFQKLMARRPMMIICEPVRVVLGAHGAGCGCDLRVGCVDRFDVDLDSSLDDIFEDVFRFLEVLGRGFGSCLRLVPFGALSPMSCAFSPPIFYFFVVVLACSFSFLVGPHNLPPRFRRLQVQPHPLPFLSRYFRLRYPFSAPCPCPPNFSSPAGNFSCDSLAAFRWSSVVGVLSVDPAIVMILYRSFLCFNNRSRRVMSAGFSCRMFSVDIVRSSLYHLNIWSES